MPSPKIKIRKKPTNKRCEKGFPCKTTCISRSKNCKEPLRWQAKTFAEWLKVQEERLLVTNQKRQKTGLSPATMTEHGYITAERTKLPQSEKVDKAIASPVETKTATANPASSAKKEAWEIPLKDYLAQHPVAKWLDDKPLMSESAGEYFLSKEKKGATITSVTKKQLEMWHKKTRESDLYDADFLVRQSNNPDSRFKFSRIDGTQIYQIYDNAKGKHEIAVDLALHDGRQVPLSVLKDYPGKKNVASPVETKTAAPSPKASTKEQLIATENRLGKELDALLDKYTGRHRTPEQQAEIDAKQKEYFAANRAIRDFNGGKAIESPTVAEPKSAIEAKSAIAKEQKSAQPKAEKAKPTSNPKSGETTNGDRQNNQVTYDGKTRTGQGLLFPVSPFISKDRDAEIARRQIPKIQEAIQKAKDEIKEEPTWAENVALLQSRISRMQHRLGLLKKIEAGEAYLPRTVEGTELEGSSDTSRSKLKEGDRVVRIKKAIRNKEDREYQREVGIQKREDDEKQAEWDADTANYDWLAGRNKIKSLQKDGAKPLSAMTKSEKLDELSNYYFEPEPRYTKSSNDRYYYTDKNGTRYGKGHDSYGSAMSQFYQNQSKRVKESIEYSSRNKSVKELDREIAEKRGQWGIKTNYPSGETTPIYTKEIGGNNLVYFKDGSEARIVETVVPVYDGDKKTQLSTTMYSMQVKGPNKRKFESLGGYERTAYTRETIEDRVKEISKHYGGIVGNAKFDDKYTITASGIASPVKQPQSKEQPNPSVKMPSTKMGVFKHTKYGYDVYSVSFDGKPNNLAEVKDKVKSLGGNYSSYNKDGAIPGYHFRDEDKAQQFMDWANGSQPRTSSRTSQRKPAWKQSFEDFRNQSIEFDKNLPSSERRSNQDVVDAYENYRKTAIAAGESVYELTNADRSLMDKTRNDRPSVPSTPSVSTPKPEITFEDKIAEWDTYTDSIKKTLKGKRGNTGSTDSRGKPIPATVYGDYALSSGGYDNWKVTRGGFTVQGLTKDQGLALIHSLNETFGKKSFDQMVEDSGLSQADFWTKKWEPTVNALTEAVRNRDTNKIKSIVKSYTSTVKTDSGPSVSPKRTQIEKAINSIPDYRDRTKPDVKDPVISKFKKDLLSVTNKIYGGKSYADQVADEDTRSAIAKVDREHTRLFNIVQGARNNQSLSKSFYRSDDKNALGTSLAFTDQMDILRGEVGAWRDRETAAIKAKANKIREDRSEKAEAEYQSNGDLGSDIFTELGKKNDKMKVIGQVLSQATLSDPVMTAKLDLIKKDKVEAEKLMWNIQSNIDNSTGNKKGVYSVGTIKEALTNMLSTIKDPTKPTPVPDNQPDLFSPPKPKDNPITVQSKPLTPREKAIADKIRQEEQKLYKPKKVSTGSKANKNVMNAKTVEDINTLIAEHEALVAGGKIPVPSRSSNTPKISGFTPTAKAYIAESLLRIAPEIKQTSPIDRLSDTAYESLKKIQKGFIEGNKKTLDDINRNPNGESALVTAIQELSHLKPSDDFRGKDEDKRIAAKELVNLGVIVKSRTRNGKQEYALNAANRDKLPSMDLGRKPLTTKEGEFISINIPGASSFDIRNTPRAVLSFLKGVGVKPEELDDYADRLKTLSFAEKRAITRFEILKLKGLSRHINYAYRAA